MRSFDKALISKQKTSARTIFHHLADEVRLALQDAMRELHHSLRALEGIPESPEKTMAQCSQIPSGFPGLFGTLGLVGLPRGDLLELAGPDGSGRRALALSLALHCQQRGGVVAWIDPENAVPSRWLSLAGLHARRTLVLRARRPELLAGSLEKLLRRAVVDVVLFGPDLLADSEYAPALSSLAVSAAKNAPITPLLNQARLAGTALVSLYTRPLISQRGGRGGRFRIGLHPHPSVETLLVARAERGLRGCGKSIQLAVRDRLVVEADVC